MTVEDTRPAWVKEALAELARKPTSVELEKRRKAFAAVEAMNLSVAPDDAVDYIRELRGPIPVEDEVQYDG